MAIVWSAWSGGSGASGHRVGIDLSVSGTTITAAYYAQTGSNSINDTQTLHRTGAISGDVSYSFSASGTPPLQKYIGSWTTSGVSGSTYYFGARLSGVYSGATPSLETSITIPIYVYPPSTPATPTLTANSSSKVTANLASAPAGNGGAILEYQWQLDGGSWVSSGTTRSKEFTGLTPNTAYRVQVAARNSAGWSSNSSWSAYATTLSEPPSAPGTPTVFRISDTSHTISWVRNHTSSAPYDSQLVQRRVYSNGWGSWVTISSALGTAVGYTDNTTTANSAYQYRVIAVNTGAPAGVASGASNDVFTTPAVATNLVASKSGSNISVTGTRNTTIASDIYSWQTSINAGAWTDVSGTTTTPDRTFTSIDPDSSHAYRTRTSVVSGTTNSSTLYSAWSASSDTVQIQAPPGAPTIVGPVVTQNRASAIRLSWVHNPTDSSIQRQYSVRHRVVGGSTWTTTGVIISSNQYYDIPANTYTTNTNVEWQVCTWGAHATSSPWSVVSVFSVAIPPVVSILVPTNPLTTPTTPLSWSYYDASWSAQVGIEYRVTNLSSGVVAVDTYRAGSSTTQELAVVFPDNTSWQIRVRAQSATGLWSEYTSITFDVSYPVPARPIGEAEWDASTGTSTVNIHNPIPNIGSAVNDFLNPKPELTTSHTSLLHFRNLFTNPRAAQNGSTMVEVWRNLCPNPLGVTGGGNLPLSNNTATWTTPASVTSFPLAHPYGLTTGIRSKRVVGSAPTTYITSIYRLDGITNTGSPERTVGAWVLVTEPGYQVESTLVWDSIAIPANTWTWVAAPRPVAAGGWAGILISAITGNASDTAEVFITGVTSMSGASVIDFYKPDPDLTPRWTGTANNSASVLEGKAIRGLSNNSTAVAVQSSWVPNGQTGSSIRVIPISATGNAYINIPAPAGVNVEATASLVVRLSAPQTGAISAPTLARGIHWAGLNTPRVQAPNQAGEHHVTLVHPNRSGALVLYNGAAIGGGDVWFYCPTIVNGSVPDLTPFHGSMPQDYFTGEPIVSYEWDGVADSSTSIMVSHNVTEWVPESPNTSAVTFSKDEVDGSYVYTFKKSSESNRAVFVSNNIGTTSTYAMFSADVYVEGLSNDNRVMVYAQGIESSPSRITPGRWVRTVFHGNTNQYTGITPRVSIRGTGDVTVHVRRVSIVQSNYRDDFNSVYFDGDDIGASWVGTASRSKSTLTSRYRVNSIQNPSFDANVSNWSATGVSISRNTDQRFINRGAGSMMITGTAAGRVSSTSIAVAQRKYVVASARITASTSTLSPPVSIGVQFYSGSTLISETAQNYVYPTVNNISSDDSVVTSPAMLIPAGATTARLIIRFDSGQNPASYTVYVDDAYLSATSNPASSTEQSRKYFDSSFPSFINQYGYTVSYSLVDTVHRETFATSVVVVSNSVYRRINGGEWVLVASGVPVNGSVIDYMSGAGPITEYRVDAYTALPSIQQSNVFELEFPDTCSIGIYLSGGSGFTTIAGMTLNLKIEESVGFVKKELYWFAGRKTPEEITTPAISRTIRVSGVIVPQKVAEGYWEHFEGTNSQPPVWRALAEMVAPHLYRDGTGRYMFGSISDVSVSETASSAINISFTITESEGE